MVFVSFSSKSCFLTACGNFLTSDGRPPRNAARAANLARKVHTLQMLSCLGVRPRAEKTFSPSSFSSRTQQAFCKCIRLSKTHLSKFSTNKMDADERRIKKKPPSSHQSLKELGDIQKTHQVFTWFLKKPPFSSKFHHENTYFSWNKGKTVKLLLLEIFEGFRRCKTIVLINFENLWCYGKSRGFRQVSKNHQVWKKIGENLEFFKMK